MCWTHDPQRRLRRLPAVDQLDNQLGGKRLTFTIEGTGPYGAGLTAAVRRRDIGIVEVMRTDRRDRKLRGESDTLDAENAARAILSGNAAATPKTNDGTLEMIRQIKIAKDLAVKDRLRRWSGSSRSS